MSMNIFENPFYILGASTKDNRHKISDLAEEKAFLSDPNIVEEARNALIIPQKRLEAELRWFPKADNTKVEDILNFFHILQGSRSLNSKIKTLDLSHLSPLALLNVSIYTFSLHNFRNNRELLNSISTIDEQFNNLNTNILYNDINDDRKNANFSMAEMTDIENAFQNYRSDIVKIINEKLVKLSQENYVILAEHIAENYNEEKVIYSDIIDDYNLRMASLLDKEKYSILNQVTEMTKHLHLVSINEFENLFSSIKKYSDIVSPSLSVAMKLGRKQISFFDDTNEILYQVRKMALELHNNCGRSEDSLKTILALKALAKFSQLFSDTLDEDIKTLEKIIADKKQREELEKNKEISKEIEPKRPKLGLVSLGLIALFIIWGIINDNKNSTSSKSYVYNNRTSQSSTSSINSVPKTNYNTSTNRTTYNQSSNSNISIESNNARLRDLEEFKKQEQLKTPEREVKEFPIPAVINGNKVNVRIKSNTSSKILKQLNSGHPVSVSNKISQFDGNWYYITTASGTKGWVRGDYLTFKSQNISYQEIENRKKSLPAMGEVNTIKLNVRNIPALRQSTVIEKLNDGDIVSVYEIFATENIDWYHINYYSDDNNDLLNGWVSGKYIKLGYFNIKNKQFELSPSFLGACFLGDAYYNGAIINDLFIPQDYERAVYWYQKAAEHGNSTGQHKLANMYYWGKGVDQDYQKAAYWYLKAANNGNANSQYVIGIMYANARGLPQDYKEARYWYLKAAEQGHVGAQLNLGVIYHNGNGVEIDYQKCLYWYRKAAAQNHSLAQLYLGYMYEEGEGVKRDVNEAISWYRKSAQQGNQEAKDILIKKEYIIKYDY